jgi:aspartyl-tRNA(Asn)/glutamyl-tRNA(Gln) amidotransferase subunit A
MVLSWTMDKVGPVCRTVEDCATVFESIMGADALDGSSVDAPFRFSPQSSVKGKRIGVVRDEFRFPSDPPMEEAYRAALKSLESLGLILEELQLEDYPYQDIARYTINIEAACAFESLWKTGTIDLMLNKQRAADWSAARLLPAIDYLKLQRLRGEICDYASTLFKRYAAIVAPASNTAAPLLFLSEVPAVNPIGIAATGGTLALGNIAGLPGITVPCGFTSSKLPLGLQWIGPAFDEAGILRLAHAYEQANTWREKHPSL